MRYLFFYLLLGFLIERNLFEETVEVCVGDRIIVETLNTGGSKFRDTKSEDLWIN